MQCLYPTRLPILLGMPVLGPKRSIRFAWSASVALTLLLHGSYSAKSVAEETTVIAQPAAKADLIVPVWPDTTPAWNAPQKPEVDTTGDDSNKIANQRLIRLTNVATPELHVFHPTGPSTGTAVLIAPGGGYTILAWDLEGTEIATWLQSLGITAIVVKYRVPTRSEEKNWLPAVQDLQRSISLLRSNGVPGVSAAEVGVLGFSAGGNASARVATAAKRMYEPTDNHDKAECIPDFAVLVYPAWLVKNGAELIEGISIHPKTPPMFFAHAANDPITCMSSVTLFGALQEQKVASELHVFSSGGHGFGGRKTESPTDAWKTLCEQWLRSQNWVKH